MVVQIGGADMPPADTFIVNSGSKVISLFAYVVSDVAQIPLTHPIFDIMVKHVRKPPFAVASIVGPCVVSYPSAR